MNVNGPDIDVTLEKENGSYVDVILVNGNDPDVDGNQTGWIPPHIDLPHYHPSFLSHLGPFSGAYLLPQTLNLSLVYTTASVPDLSCRTARASRRLILFSVFDMTHFQGQTVPFLAHAPYPHVFYVFSLARWIPEKTP